MSCHATTHDADKLPVFMAWNPLTARAMYHDTKFTS